MSKVQQISKSSESKTEEVGEEMIMRSTCSEKQTQLATYQVNLSTYQVNLSTYQVNLSTYQVNLSTYQVNLSGELINISSLLSYHVRCV